MKKAIFKKLMILSFAFGALFLIGNNVFVMAQVSIPPGGFDNGKKIMTTPSGNYCCCASKQAYCIGTYATCNSDFCSDNP